MKSERKQWHPEKWRNSKPSLLNCHYAGNHAAQWKRKQDTVLSLVVFFSLVTPMWKLLIERTHIKKWNKTDVSSVLYFNFLVRIRNIRCETWIVQHRNRCPDKKNSIHAKMIKFRIFFYLEKHFHCDIGTNSITQQVHICTNNMTNWEQDHRKALFFSISNSSFLSFCLFSKKFPIFHLALCQCCQQDLYKFILKWRLMQIMYNSTSRHNQCEKIWPSRKNTVVLNTFNCKW